MAPSTSTTSAVNLSLATQVFLVMLTSIFSVEFIIRTFSHSKLRPFDDNQLLIGLTTAILATLLIVTLFLRTRQLNATLKEKELLKAKEDLEDTLNTMPDFVSVHDKDFKVTKVNNALCEFLNKRPEEIIGKQCFQVFHNSSEPYKNCSHKKTSELGHPVTEIVNDPNIGVPLQITCSPFFDDDGTFQGSLHTARVSEEINHRRNKAGEIFPICASCKSIRNNDSEWVPLEDYFIKKHEFQFTHTFCRDCQEKLYPEFIKP